MTQLIVDGISKQYNDKTALYSFTMHAEPGSCIVLCGGNGAGKSTMIHIVAGISLPKTGTVKVGDTDMNGSRKEYLKKIGYMPDDYHAQETLSVGEFLRFYASIRQVPAERVDTVLDMIGLAEQRTDLVRSLSKGMKQRLLFGQSILSDPELLVMDEPTNGLDPFWVDRFISILKELKDKGTIILFSTHMMDVAAEIGTDILFMREGVVKERLDSTMAFGEKISRLIKLHRN
ncbi:ABC transporter ATP-binding protein [Rossellomorea vietnamensis]|uniref:ABC transporter ATP-binding protein n=1 Tax=Rossellomorea vietnamensis TaxID=218284 RepID=UPI001E3CB992|nr:ABC transporter ATP-binding protein [Rossellomorea vietnamensis]MCC5800805.1 ABC transporter ATP-binding protein [Rossellomorea vietnamensis]